MARKILNGLDLVNQKVINVADPTAATDAATKQYVDNVANGLVQKAAVRAATTAAITLSGAQTIDGVSIIAGDRVLVKDQASAPTNGVYVAAAGAWARSEDANTSAEVQPGFTTFVSEGTVNGNKSYTLTTDGPIVLGTTALTFTQSGGTGTTYTADGTSITLTGTTFSITPTYSGLAKRYAANVPNGSTSAVITHSLGTLDVIVQVNEVSGGAVVEPDVTITSTTQVTLTFAVAPTVGQYRVVILA